MPPPKRMRCHSRGDRLEAARCGPLSPRLRSYTHTHGVAECPRAWPVGSRPDSRAGSPHGYLVCSAVILTNHLSPPYDQVSFKGVFNPSLAGKVIQRGEVRSPPLLPPLSFSPSPSHPLLLTLSFSPSFSHPLLLALSFSPSPPHPPYTLLHGMAQRHHP